MIALVIPTSREKQALEFLAAWQEQLEEANVVTYLVEDNEEQSFAIKESNYFKLNHLCWKTAPQSLLDCINLKSPGCRQIGFWKAYQDGCDVIVTLDDDVRPIQGPNLFTSFYSILINGIPLWVDPMLNYRSRGYPVDNVGKTPVAFHLGAFLGVPDVDGQTQLENESQFESSPPEYVPRPTIVPQGQLVPVNGGICGWRRELTPYIHYSLWDQDLRYKRFDDIWMGIILKKWMDLCGLQMSYGPPYVKHIRASNATENQKNESEGKIWNEQFWKKFYNNIPSQNITMDYQKAYEIVIEGLIKIDNSWARREANAMKSWNHLFI